MTATGFRFASLLASLGVLLLTVTACASERSGSPAPSVPPEPSASPSATADPLPVPNPALAVTCEELVPAGLGAGLLLERLAPLAPPTYGPTDPALPEDFATRQAGGISCSTQNAEPRSVDDTLNPAWVSIQARVLPRAADGFTVLLDAQGPPLRSSDTVVSCSEGPAAYCYLDLLVGDTWVTADFYGVDPTLPRDEFGAPAQIAELATGIRSVVAAAPYDETTWTAPPDTVALALDCSTFFGPERLQADFGVGEPMYLDPYEDYISSERVARENAPALSCPWSSESRRDYGGHSVLLGGEWAFREQQSAGAFDGYDSVSLSGLQAPDVALISCSPERGRCIADTVVGRHWVQMHVLFASPAAESDAVAELTALMQTTVDVVGAGDGGGVAG